MKTSTPGKPARGSQTGRPLMVLLDLMGRRMALRILWELWCSPRPLTFRELQAAAETNPGVLNTRLRELRKALLVHRGPDGYEVTADGRSLKNVLHPLQAWSVHWAETAHGFDAARPPPPPASGLVPAGTEIILKADDVRIRAGTRRGLGSSEIV